MIIPTESRTKNQIFEDWKKTNPKTTWSVYWLDYQEKLINLYEKLNWWIVPISPIDKTPLKGFKWKNRSLIYDKIIKYYLSNKINIAVNLKKSNLIAIDLDSNKIPPVVKELIYMTYSQITRTSHYHLLFKYDKKFSDKAIKELGNKITTASEFSFRGGNNEEYILISPSRLPLKENDNISSDKYYEFFNLDKLMNFSDLMEMINEIG